MSNIFTNFSIVALLLFISSVFIFIEDLLSNITYLLKIFISTYIWTSFTTIKSKTAKLASILQ